MSGDSKNRITSQEKYAKGWATVFEPKEPFSADIKVYESAYVTNLPESILVSEVIEDLGLGGCKLPSMDKWK